MIPNTQKDAGCWITLAQDSFSEWRAAVAFTFKKQGQQTAAVGSVGEQRQQTEAVDQRGDGSMVTSGSFWCRRSRWAADVKGKPVKPVRSTLDIGCPTGMRG